MYKIVKKRNRHLKRAAPLDFLQLVVRQPFYNSQRLAVLCVRAEQLLPGAAFREQLVCPICLNVLCNPRDFSCLQRVLLFMVFTQRQRALQASAAPATLSLSRQSFSAPCAGPDFVVRPSGVPPQPCSVNPFASSLPFSHFFSSPASPQAQPPPSSSSCSPVYVEVCKPQPPSQPSPSSPAPFRSSSNNPPSSADAEAAKKEDPCSSSPARMQ